VATAALLQDKVMLGHYRGAFIWSVIGISCLKELVSTSGVASAAEWSLLCYVLLTNSTIPNAE